MRLRSDPQMHKAAYEWVARFSSGNPLQVLDIGGRDINGSCRPLFPAADYTALDIAPGDGVDIVADAAAWTPDQIYDLVLCAEVFEHTDSWPQICKTALAATRPGGLFIVTCAGPGRAPHSAVDGRHRLFPGEHYGNVEPGELATELTLAGWTKVVVDQLGEDVRAHAEAR